MFVFQAGQMLAELERWAPDILAATQPPARPRRCRPRIDAAAYARIRSQPIDKAVMEHSMPRRGGASRPPLVRCRLVARDLGADGQG